jgi:hypothetical protein
VLYCLNDGANCADIERGASFKVEKVEKVEGDEIDLFDGEWWLTEHDLTWQKPKTKREGWGVVTKDEFRFDEEKAKIMASLHSSLVAVHGTWEE